jgi:hypothetical protein
MGKMSYKWLPRAIFISRLIQLHTLITNRFLDVKKKNVLVVLGLELRASHLLHQSFFVLGISEIGSQEQFPGWPQTSILLSFAS